MERRLMLVTLMVLLGGLVLEFTSCYDNRPFSPRGGQFQVGPPPPTATFTPTLIPTATDTPTPTSTPRIV